MTHRVVLLAACALAATMNGACESRPLRSVVESPVLPPSAILDFTILYGTNCSGCHGANGEGGVALGLNNPVYLAIADDATLRRVVADGVQGTAMPAFARAAGGLLTDQQIETIVRGIRVRWARPAVLDDAKPPPYDARVPGDPTRGGGVFSQHCASCHGASGRGGPDAGSIVEAAYLALVSDRSLRTTIIAGRPDLGHPDWRGNAPDLSMSSDDVSDVAAWLAAQRTPLAGPTDLSRKETP